ncbi:hypothetical protein T265_13191, partial [Opisthorchis viverrini]
MNPPQVQRLEPLPYIHCQSKITDKTYACAHYGLVVVPLYDTFGEEALKYIINQTKMRIIICDTMIRAHILLTWAGEDLKDIIVIEADREALHKMNDQTNNMPKMHTYEEMLVHGSKLPPEKQEANPDDLFLVCYTSGATGFPKGVMHTHRSFLRATTMSTAVLAITGLPEHGNLHISYLPLSHIMEQVIMNFGSLHYCRHALVICTHPPILLYFSRGVFRRAGFLDRFFFRELRGQFGGRIQFVASGSAPLQSEVLQFVKAAFSCPVSVSATTTEYVLKNSQNREYARLPLFLFCFSQNGVLKIVDRCKNVFKLAQGEYVSPEKVEQIYALSPLVINIFVDGQPLYNFAVGVVVPDFKQLRTQYLTQLIELFGVIRIAQLDIVEVCRHKGVAKLILEDLVTIGKKKGLKGFEQVRIILHVYVDF